MFAEAMLALPPDHAVDDARVGLDYLHDLGGHGLRGVVGHGGLGEAVLRVERHRGAHGVEEPRSSMPASTMQPRSMASELSTRAWLHATRRYRLS